MRGRVDARRDNGGNIVLYVRRTRGTRRKSPVTPIASHAGPARSFARRIGYEVIGIERSAEIDYPEHHHHNQRQHECELGQRAAASQFLFWSAIHCATRMMALPFAVKVAGSPG